MVEEIDWNYGQNAPGAYGATFDDSPSRGATDGAAVSYSEEDVDEFGSADFGLVDDFLNEALPFSDDLRDEVSDELPHSSHSLDMLQKAACPAPGEENLPTASPAKSTVGDAAVAKVQAAPVPSEPPRPVGPPLKPARGTVNKKKTAPKRLDTARRADGKTRTFQCSYPGCNHSATKRRYITEHERTHSGERPYKCPWPGCTYAASGQGHLSRHKRTHTGDRPYPCTYPGCTYQASQSGHLRTHMRTHTGERPYKCPVAGCGYAASRKGHLDRHMSIHALRGEAKEATR